MGCVFMDLDNKKRKNIIFNAMSKHSVAMALISSLTILLTLSFSSIYLNNNFKSQMALQYFKLVRNNIIIGDKRSAILDLNKSLDHFYKISYSEKDHSSSFTIGETEKPFPLLGHKKSFEIKLSDNSPSKGELSFFFNIKELVIFVMISWMISSLLLIPIVLYVFKIFKSKEQLRLELISIQSTKLITDQVAHDIRSPLAALNMIAQKVSHKNDNSRMIMNNAITRINDIANNLLEKNRTGKKGPDKTNICMLSGIVAGMISEKRTQFSNYPQIQINFVENKNVHNCFVKIYPQELKRIISNIINNSLEAIPDKTGSIDIEIINHFDGKFCTIKITDTGKGIPQELLPQIWNKGSTFNKSQGNGLGLFMAKEKIKQWGGSIDIKSKLNQGTTVTITIPLAPTPAWFLPELKIDSNSQILITDDDHSFLKMWQEKLESLSLKENNIGLNIFSSIEQLEKQYQSNNTQNSLILIDYDFNNSSETGLDFIERHKINNAILVTAHYDEPKIIKRCLNAEIKLIPKNMVPSLDIFINAPKQTIKRHVLIDDDQLLHLAWEDQAQSSNIDLVCFSSSKDFFQNAPSLNRDSIIHIDSSLQEEIPGEQTAKEIYSMGFKEIYLTTGYEENDFPPMPWIKKIIGKTPPWKKEHGTFF